MVRPIMFFWKNSATTRAEKYMLCHGMSGVLKLVSGDYRLVRLQRRWASSTETDFSLSRALDKCLAQGLQ